jgi:hypothetical protein
MYYLIVIATTVVLPIGSALIEYVMALGPALSHQPEVGANMILFLGKWYVFWAGGARLFLAGLRQTFAPAMTLRQIFEIENKPSEHIVQELGFANLSIGLICLLSLPYPQLMPAGALAAGLFYGLAGLQHLRKKARNAQRTVAMATDLVVFLVLVANVTTFMWHMPTK